MKGLTWRSRLLNDKAEYLDWLWDMGLRRTKGPDFYPCVAVTVEGKKELGSTFIYLVDFQAVIGTTP